MKKKIIFKFYSYSYGKLKKYLLKKIVALEGGQMYSQTLRNVYKSKYKISIGYGSYGGCFNLKNYLPADVNFGNYCSVAQNIRIFRANHPKNTFTTHPLLYNPVAGYVKNDMLERPSLTIGHDVWIGEWAVILPGVKKIGNGSIIGAGSIVTKDVEPYSIVVGNPAKSIGKRFDNATIAVLEQEEWWLMNKSELIQNISRLNSLVNYNIQS